MKPMDPAHAAMAPDRDAQKLGRTLEFMRLLWGLDHALQKRSKWMATRYGLTGPQRLVLRIVGRVPQMSAGHLAATLKIDPSTLTGVLQRLERRGLLARRIDRGDRRRQRIQLTRRGRVLLGSAPGSIEQAVGSALRRRTAPELRATARVLRTLIDALEAGVDGSVPRVRSAGLEREAPRRG